MCVNDMRATNRQGRVGGSIYGMTFVAMAPEHPLVELLTTPERRATVNEYREAVRYRSAMDRLVGKNKTGVFTGAYAINPVNGQRVPIWVADYVLLIYGSGAIHAVPANDERDFAFAKQFGLAIQEVVCPGKSFGHDPDEGIHPSLAEAYLAEGVMINSQPWNGLPSEDRRKAIALWLENNGYGQRRVRYRLRDWLISRQRYWGPPIPIIYCQGCGTVPVPEKDLPVLLPYVENFTPTDGSSPLAKPDEYIDRYGADTLRMYLMFIGPYDQGGDFSDAGNAGVSRFLARIAVRAERPLHDAPLEAIPEPAQRVLHRSLKKVTEDLQNLKYNTASAALMEYVNVFQMQRIVYRAEIETLLLMLAPFAPHVTEEFWERIGCPFSIHAHPWPIFDPLLARPETLEIAVQVNGKTRDIIQADTDATESLIKARALAAPTGQRYVAGKHIKRMIYVPGRVINIVL
jgi:leucyl-tRNA synthetase